MKGGQGVARNDRRAVELLRKACDGGSAQGCANLQAMYGQGRGVGRQYDSDDAEHAQRDCLAGRPSACDDLGRMAEAGRGVARDPKHALELYRKACDGGNASGCRHACAAGDTSRCGHPVR
jgi:TPR repeat protein